MHRRLNEATFHNFCCRLWHALPDTNQSQWRSTEPDSLINPSELCHKIIHFPYSVFAEDMAEILADSFWAQPCRDWSHGAVRHAWWRGSEGFRHCEARGAQEVGQTGDSPDRLSEHHPGPRRELSHGLLCLLFKHHLMHLHHRCSHSRGLDLCSVPASISGMWILQSSLQCVLGSNIPVKLNLNFDNYI